MDSRSSDEKTAAWQFARAVCFRFQVNARASVHARHHNVAGTDVNFPVLQLCPWGQQQAQFITIDASSFNAIAASIGVACVPAGEAHLQVAGMGKLAPYFVMAGWRNVKFFGNMLRRIEARKFACPRSVRTNGYSIQVSSVCTVCLLCDCE